jgi:CheY-specific phosphatase CheX
VTDTEVKKLFLDEALAQDVIAGVERTLFEILGARPVALPFKMSSGFEVGGDVSGIIAIMQKEISGSMVISFPKATIFGILQKIYRKSFTTLDHSVRMGVGELTNIIFGVVKSGLNKKGMGLQMAIPNVISGDHHVITNMATQNVLIIPFSVEAGTFTVSIALLGSLRN